MKDVDASVDSLIENMFNNGWHCTIIASTPWQRSTIKKKSHKYYTTCFRMKKQCFVTKHYHWLAMLMFEKFLWILFLETDVQSRRCLHFKLLFSAFTVPIMLDLNQQKRFSVYLLVILLINYLTSVFFFITLSDTFTYSYCSTQ